MKSHPDSPDQNYDAIHNEQVASLINRGAPNLGAVRFPRAVYVATCGTALLVVLAATTSVPLLGLFITILLAGVLLLACIYDSPRIALATVGAAFALLVINFAFVQPPL